MAEKYGAKIIEARTRAKMTQEELAERLGIERERVNRYEHDRAIPKMKMFKKISEILGVQIDYFIGETEPQDKNIWRNPETNPPAVETEVLILYRCNGYLGITTAYYEDGNVFSEDSEWNWTDLSEWGTYDEERDDYRIPKGWWEYRHFNPDDVYNNRVDSPVVGWMPLPPKEVAKNENT